MALFNRFPWTNFHELNLDWVIRVAGDAEKALPKIDEAVGRVEQAVQNSETAVDNANAAVGEAEEAANNADAAADKLRNLTVGAESIPTDAPAQAYVRDTATGFDIRFYIPVGASGVNAAANMIDNSNFKDPVNQRGESSYSSGFTIDRWYFSADGSNASFNVAANGITITNTASNYCNFTQYNDRVDPNKGYTFAVCDSKGNISLVNGRAGVRVSQNTDFGSLAADMSGANPAFIVSVNSGKSVTLVWAAAYEGIFSQSDIPAYTIPRFSDEYINACRYYYVVTPDDIMVAGIATGTNSFRFNIPLKVPMRAEPVLTIGNISWLRNHGTQISDRTISQYTISNRKSSVDVNITMTGNSLTTNWAAGAQLSGGVSLNAEIVAG